MNDSPALHHTDTTADEADTEADTVAVAAMEILWL